MSNKLNILLLNNSLVPSAAKTLEPIIAKGDSGASAHCFAYSSKNQLINVHHANGPEISLPNQQKIKTTATANIPFRQFSHAATKTYLLKDLQKTNLISLGQLCDDNCFVVLTKKKLYVCKDKQLLLQGYRNQDDGLWDITIDQKQNNITKMPPKLNALLFQPLQLKTSKLRKININSVVNKINQK